MLQRVGQWAGMNQILGLGSGFSSCQCGREVRECRFSERSAGYSLSLWRPITIFASDQKIAIESCRPGSMLLWLGSFYGV